MRSPARLAGGDVRCADDRRALCRSVVGRELIVDRWLAARVARHGLRQGKRLRRLRDFLGVGFEPAPAGLPMQ